MVYIVVTLLILSNTISLLIEGSNLYITVINFSLLLLLLILIKNRKKETVIVEKVITPPPVESQPHHIESVDNTEIEELLLEASEKFHFFKLSIPLMEELTRGTQEFEETTLKRVFTQFEEIWNESETLIKESEITMESIFDTDKSTNLGYILASSKEINHDFNAFIPVLESMNQLTEQFVHTSHESFKTISQTTKEIEDLAEQVKVISINVRIEAARIQDSGGFKVLGADISNFADKTSQFAQATNDKINNTLVTIDTLKSDLEKRLKEVSSMAKLMSNKINPFESILEQSAISLKDIISKLNRVSGELNYNVKNSLANLQFQDVTRQESEHIIEFLKHIESIVSFFEKIDNDISAERDREIKEEILHVLDRLSTTGNEAKRVEEFSRKWQVELKREDIDDFNSVDDGTFLF